MTQTALFDEYGRRIPPTLQAPVNVRSRRYFHLEQPSLDYAAIYDRIARYFGTPANLDAAAFERRVRAILAGLAANPVTAGLLRGVQVPFFIPKTAERDPGAALDAHHLAAVGTSFEAVFPQYRFTNHNKVALGGLLEVQPTSRHERLLDAASAGDVVGCYFPCLTEYSLPAVLEQMATLPESLLLAGGLDTCAALTGSPALLQRDDGYPNLLWLAALRAEKAAVGYYFEAYGHNLTFNRRTHFGQVSEYWASALVVLG